MKRVRFYFCFFLLFALNLTSLSCAQPVGVSNEDVVEISKLTDSTKTVNGTIHYDVTIESSHEAKNLDFQPEVELAIQVYENPAIIGDNCDYANIRETAKVTSAVIGQVSTGGIVNILSDTVQNGYLLAESGGIQGYVYESSLVRGEKVFQTAMEKDKCYAVVTAEKTNLCLEPAEDTVVMANLSNGQDLEIIGVIGDFYEVLAGDAVGYIRQQDCAIGYSLEVATAVYIPGITVAPTPSPYTIVSPAPAVQNTSAVEMMIAYAQQFLGVPYVYGGNSLSSGLDCSSFTMQVFANSVGLSLPRTSYSQCYYGTGISVSERQRGDLLFYAYKSTNINHVAIYLGDNKILHCTSYTNSVTITDYNYCGEPVICRRFF